MSSPPPLTPDEKRDALRAKIEASERRIAERTLAEDARAAAGVASDYAKTHPLIVIGGALAVGLLIGAMTKPGRRAVGRATTGAADIVSGAASSASRTVRSAAKKSSSKFGSTIADAIVAYGVKLIDDVLDGAQAGQDRIEDFGESAGTKARKIKRDAKHLAGSTADKSRALGRRTKRKAKRAVRGLTGRIASGK